MVICSRRFLEIIHVFVVDFSKELVPVVLSPLIYSEVADIPLNRLIQDNTVMSTNVVKYSF